MTDFAEIPAPAPIGIGHNRPPLRDMLADQYAALTARASQLIDAAARVPEITDDETVGKVGDYIKAVTAAVKKIEATRVAEKEPFLAAGREVDGFFKHYTDLLDRAKRATEAKVSTYLRAKAEAERKRREEEERAAREAAEAKMREAMAAEQARNAAERDTLLAQAVEAEVQVVAAAKAAEAKPAELARTRGELGSVATLRTTWDMEIVDAGAIPLDALRPFIARADLEKAVRGFVRAGGRELPGVRIFETQTAVVR